MPLTELHAYKSKGSVLFFVSPVPTTQKMLKMFERPLPPVKTFLYPTCLLKLSSQKLLKMFPAVQEKVQSSQLFKDRFQPTLRANILKLDCLESNPSFAT